MFPLIYSCVTLKKKGERQVSWVIFNLCLLSVLMIDLGVFHSKDHVITHKEAFTWCGVWFTLACLFGVYTYVDLGAEKALEFSAGYLLELSLSLDNVFIFVLLFKRFAVPAEYQYRVLFWGVLGALVMRALMIIVGIKLLDNFYWMIYIFGAFLVFTGIKMLLSMPTEDDIGEPFIVRFLRKYFPVTDKYHGHDFIHKRGKKYYLTPLFVVLILVEASDLLFALDSIPAIFAITRDPFIVYTSNVFAILGLRSMYFALAHMVNKFKGLHYGLSIILVFIGTKMLLSYVFHLPVWITLGFIISVLATSIIVSVQTAKKR